MKWIGWPGRPIVGVRVNRAVIQATSRPGDPDIFRADTLDRFDCSCIRRCSPRRKRAPADNETGHAALYVLRESLALDAMGSRTTDSRTCGAAAFPAESGR